MPAAAATDHAAASRRRLADLGWSRVGGPVRGAAAADGGRDLAVGRPGSVSGMRLRLPLVAGAAVALSAAVAFSASLPAQGPPLTPQAGLAGIHKIRHVIMIMQENRSLDSY